MAHTATASCRINRSRGWGFAKTIGPGPWSRPQLDPSGATSHLSLVKPGSVTTPFSTHTHTLTHTHSLPFLLLPWKGEAILYVCTP